MEYNIVERVTRLERRIRELEEKIKDIGIGIDRIDLSNIGVKTIEKKEDKEEESI